MTVEMLYISSSLFGGILLKRNFRGNFMGFLSHVITYVCERDVERETYHVFSWKILQAKTLVFHFQEARK